MIKKIIPNEYYHILNRGNNKQPIFKDERDWVRFLFLILYLQSPVNLRNISRQVHYFIKNEKFRVSDNTLKEIVNNRSVELVVFILMPNHFHLILKELVKGGISKYMQRILNSHTKYFNNKNEISGHLFQGSFKAIHIEDDAQLIYLSAYIHNNVKELGNWSRKEELFPYSSFQDYIKENRWGELLKRNIILDQFLDKEKYRLFVKESGAKDKSVQH